MRWGFVCIQILIFFLSLCKINKSFSSDFQTFSTFTSLPHRRTLIFLKKNSLRRKISIYFLFLIRNSSFSLNNKSNVKIHPLVCYPSFGVFVATLHYSTIINIISFFFAQKKASEKNFTLHDAMMMKKILFQLHAMFKCIIIMFISLYKSCEYYNMNDRES
jgi:hypothetical protein